MCLVLHLQPYLLIKPSGTKQSLAGHQQRPEKVGVRPLRSG